MDTESEVYIMNNIYVLYRTSDLHKSTEINGWVFLTSYKTRSSALKKGKELKHLYPSYDFAIARFKNWDFGKTWLDSDSFEVYI